MEKANRPSSRVVDGELISSRAVVDVFGVDGPTLHLFLRALLCDVPVQAVDTVTFSRYDGPLESEMVAFQLGQVPIRGEGPMTFQVSSGPHTGPLTWATTDDVCEESSPGRVVLNSTGDKVGPAGIRNRILLAPLLAGQALMARCRTSVGTGRRHARWGSVFPVFHPRKDDAGATFTQAVIQTTGACTAAYALAAAIKSLMDLFGNLEQAALFAEANAWDSSK